MISSLTSSRITHSLKTGFACLIGYLLTLLPDTDLDAWIVISIIVVMSAQINVGGVLQKSYMRFFGTVTGCLIAAFTLFLFGKNPIAIGSMVVVSAIIFSYLATSKSQFSDAGTLGAVTTTIILINPENGLFAAFHRCAEISMGLLIAALVTQFVFPLHARYRLGKMQAQTLQQFSIYYRMTMLDSADEEKFLKLDEDIVKYLAEQRTLAKESKSEHFGKSFNLLQFSQILNSEKEIFRAMVCLRYARDSFPQDKILLLQTPLILNFHQNVCLLLEKISEKLRNKHEPAITMILDSENVKHYIENLPATVEEKIYFNGFVFCAELLAKQMNLLVGLLS